MFAVVCSYVHLLDAVASRRRLPFHSYLREVMEDGDLLGGVEIEIDVPGSDALTVRRFFWSQSSVELSIYENAAFQLSAICVTISRRYILEEAVRRICGTIHAFELTDDDDDTVMASVKIDLQPHSKSILPTQQLFFGESTQFSGDAIESTCSAALNYLVAMGIITIDDYNSTNLKKCQRQLKAEHFWSSALYDRAKSFQKQLASLTATKTGPPSESDDDSTPAPRCVNELEDGLNDTAGSLPPNEETSDNEPDHRLTKKTKSLPTARRTLVFKD